MASVEEVVSENSSQNDDLLRKQGWYLGELSEEAAGTVIETSGKTDVFMVHKTSDSYVLSVRFSVSGTDEGIIEHLKIKEDDGKILIDSQSGPPHDSIIAAVEHYTSSCNPPLTPALIVGKMDLQAQMSIISMSDPPAYEQANKQLQPDIAPLPNITNVNTQDPVEAKAGRISPSGSLQHDRYNSYNSYNSYDSWRGPNRDPEPQYMFNSHWWRYRDKSCCHPKNTCHCCWHRETYWNGRREVPEHSWYNCKGTGFCRCLLLSLMWCFGWPFVLIGLCCYGCCILCYFCCIGFDDD